MAYHLRKDQRKKGVYLRIYFSYRKPETRTPTCQHVKTLGYVDDLIAQGIADPIAYYTKEVQRMNDEITAPAKDAKAEKIPDNSLFCHLGFFPLASVAHHLHVEEIIHLLGIGQRFSFSIYDCLMKLVYAKAVLPQDPHQSIDCVFDQLYGQQSFSQAQMSKCLTFMADMADRITDVFFYNMNEIYGYDTSRIYWHTFEIPVYNRWDLSNVKWAEEGAVHLSIGLLLDGNLIPISMRITDDPEGLHLWSCLELIELEDKIDHVIHVLHQSRNPKELQEILENGQNYIIVRSLQKQSEPTRQWILDTNGYKKSINPINGQHYFCKAASDKEKQTALYQPDLVEEERIRILQKAFEAREYMKSICENESGSDELFDGYIQGLPAGQIQAEELWILDETRINEDLNLAGCTLLSAGKKGIQETDVCKAWMIIEKMEQSLHRAAKTLNACPKGLSDLNSVTRVKICILVEYLIWQLERILQNHILQEEFDLDQICALMQNFNLAKISDKEYLNLGVPTALMKLMAERFALPVLNRRLNPSQIKKVLERVF